ncbi:MAG: hypothetical protein KDM91_19875 [Verrucomicrobiae bacterium]|nr:hypothetical protein [Verrucomicrobiae bacterium]MCP5539628.1 hypothetical protein [Akkermansiaceae bacterium]MCP5549366.1 hypothetical protein [Akkermansiaceae bacterium]
MKKIGSFLAIAGIVSAVLSFLGMNLKILMWIDLWGPTAGWLIRAALIVGGGLLWFLGPESDDGE